MSRDNFDAAGFLFRRMDDADWKALLPHLWRFAGYWLGRYHWPVPAARPTPEDIACNALAKLLEDPTIWKPHIYQKHLKRKDALRAFLFTLIVKEIQKEWNRAFTRWRVDLPLEEGGDDASEGKTPPPEAADRGESAEDRMDRLKKEKLLQRIQRYCDERGYGEEFRLRFVMDLKPRDIARILGVPKERIYSRVAQLKVLIKRKFREEAWELFNGKLDGDDEEADNENEGPEDSGSEEEEGAGDNEDPDPDEDPTAATPRD